MNEDELRAFLESATVGDDDQQSDDLEQQNDQEAEAADAAPAAADPSQPELDRRPSFDELMGIKRDPAPADPAPVSAAAAAPAAEPARPAAPAGNAAGDDPELVPLVLPGPSTRPAAPTRSTPPQRPAQPATPPADPRPAVPAAAAAAPAAPVPAAKPASEPVEPIPATAPLPLGLEELFGQQETAAAAPPPSAESEYERIAVTGGEKKRFIPWIVVGAGAIIALVAAILIVLSVRGGDSETDPTTAPPTTEQPTETTPSEPDPEPVEPEPNPNEPPVVEVGPTGDFPIPAWGLQGEISAQFGWPQYRFEGENLILHGGTLLPQFPESCAEMREGFGLTRMADGTLEVLRPAQTCAEAPELYDQVWGLTAATIPTFKPV